MNSTQTSKKSPKGQSFKRKLSKAQSSKGISSTEENRSMLIKKLSETQCRNSKCEEFGHTMHHCPKYVCNRCSRPGHTSFICLKEKHVDGHKLDSNVCQSCKNGAIHPIGACNSRFDQRMFCPMIVVHKAIDMAYLSPHIQKSKDLVLGDWIKLTSPGTDAKVENDILSDIKPTVEVTKPTVEVAKPIAKVTKPTVEVTKPTVEVAKTPVEVAKPVAKPVEMSKNQTVFYPAAESYWLSGVDYNTLVNPSPNPVSFEIRGVTYFCHPGCTVTLTL
jgi:hypothetical protein